MLPILRRPAAATFQATAVQASTSVRISHTAIVAFTAMLKLKSLMRKEQTTLNEINGPISTAAHKQCPHLSHLTARQLNKIIPFANFAAPDASMTPSQMVKKAKETFAILTPHDAITLVYAESLLRHFDKETIDNAMKGLSIKGDSPLEQTPFMNLFQPTEPGKTTVGNVVDFERFGKRYTGLVYMNGFEDNRVCAFGLPEWLVLSKSEIKGIYTLHPEHIACFYESQGAQT